MPPEEEEEKKLEEEEMERYPEGYRAWDIFLKGGAPRLKAMTRDVPWEPEVEYGIDPLTGEEIPVKVVKSDWPGEEEPFDKSSHGLYFLKTLQEAKSQYPNAALYGALIGYGKIQPGSIGYRVQKAKVTHIFRAPIPCYICRKPAKFIIHDNENFPLCERHLKKVEAKVKEFNYTQEEVEMILQRLADVYEAKLVEEPKLEG